MDAFPLTHPIERFLLCLTIVALLGVVFWKAGGPPLTASSPIHRQPT